MIAYTRKAESWHPNPSVVKVPTIWSAADLGTVREAQTVTPSRSGSTYPLIHKPWDCSGTYFELPPAPMR